MKTIKTTSKRIAVLGTAALCLGTLGAANTANAAPGRSFDRPTPVAQNVVRNDNNFRQVDFRDNGRNNNWRDNRGNDYRGNDYRDGRRYDDHRDGGSRTKDVVIGAVVGGLIGGLLCR